MMKKIMAGLCVAAAMAGVSGTAMAENGKFYILGAAGQITNDSSKTEMDSLLTSVGGIGFASSYSKPTVYKLQVGYQINENFAAEGGYIGSNKATYSASGGNLAGPISASASVSGWSLTAVGILPIASQFSLLGKLGVAALRTGANITGPGGTASTSGSKTDLTYGVGAKYDFTNAIFGRLDLDSYKMGSSTASSRGTVWTLGVGYKF